MKFTQQDFEAGKAFYLNDKKDTVYNYSKKYNTVDFSQSATSTAHVLHIERYGFRFQALCLNGTATGYVAFNQCLHA